MLKFSFFPASLLLGLIMLFGAATPSQAQTVQAVNNARAAYDAALRQQVAAQTLVVQRQNELAARRAELAAIPDTPANRARRRAAQNRVEEAQERLRNAQTALANANRTVEQRRAAYQLALNLYKQLNCRRQPNLPLCSVSVN